MSSSENFLNNFHDQGDNLFKVDNIVLKPCSICGRTFNPKSLERHVKVCEKSKKCIRRNVFNSFSQRATELGAVPVSNGAKEEEKCKKGKDDRENISRLVKGEKKFGLNLMNNGLSQQKKGPSGYQQCPSCNRYFNQKAADRHIAWCREQQTRLPKTPPSSEALERLKARVKYQAPLPKRKENGESSLRLVKSAESIREPSLKRTHSSPSIPVREIKILRHKSVENCSISLLKSNAQKKGEQRYIEKSVPMYPSNNISSHEMSHSSHENSHSETQAKKAVKFKEIFPVYKKERNKNLDMLAALKLQLSKLEMSGDLSDDLFKRSNENEFERKQQKHSDIAPRDIWTSDGEAHGSPSSSSDGSLPSLSHADSSEPRMPRFCYNCGTKYPIVSAKFCCECGARRFGLGANNNQIYA